MQYDEDLSEYVLWDFIMRRFNLSKCFKVMGDGNHAMRIMPNIASRFGESATCISFSENNKAQAQAVITLFEDLGTAPVIDEKLMDAATVLAASGTAFALRYIRASMQAGIEIGFDWKTALAISAQTVKGAEMLMEEQVNS
jgi:pyrroline-5-carboxylate reductase